MEKFGCLSLAINQAAAFMVRNKWTLHQYLSMLEESDERRDEHLSAELQDPRRPVAGLISFSAPGDCPLTRFVALTQKRVDCSFLYARSTISKFGPMSLKLRSYGLAPSSPWR